MPRINRAWLENAAFGHHYRVVTRFADLGERGELSDVAVAKTFEEGRFRLFQTALGRINRYQRVIAGTVLEFVAPMTHPDPVDVSTGVLEIGRTSFRIGQIARQNGRIGAYADIAVVVRNDQGAQPISDEWRATLEGLRVAVPGSALEKFPRLDRTRLDKGAFPHGCEITTRFADMDRIGHVNNVAMTEILQEGRFRFCHDAGMTASPPRQFVVAATFVEYADDVLYPDPVDVATAVLAVGRTSFRTAQVALQGGRPVVYAEAVMVVRDEHGPIPIPQEWHAKLERARR